MTLAHLYFRSHVYATNRLGEAEPLMRRAVSILVEFTADRALPSASGSCVCKLADLLAAMGKSQAEIEAAGAELMRPLSAANK